MKAKRFMENAIHGFFLLMGLVTVGCVLLISVYLVVSGIPAIREIGLVKFLFGPVWNSNAAEPQFGILPFILTSIYGTAGAILLGDLLAMWSEQMYARSGLDLAALERGRPVLEAMRTEVTCGQVLDVVAQSAPASSLKNSQKYAFIMETRS